VRAIAEFVHKKKSTVQNRLGLVKDAAVAEAVLREQIPPTAGFHILRLPAPEREGYLRAAIAQRRTVEQIKADVERRLTPRRPTLEFALDAGDRAPDARPSADGGADVVVRGHRRRRPGSGPGGEDAAAVAAERRTALLAERDRLLSEIEALETDLHRAQGALRGVERELASNDWTPFEPERAAAQGAAAPLRGRVALPLTAAGTPADPEPTRSGAAAAAVLRERGA
jgi:hypothetical protein